MSWQAMKAVNEQSRIERMTLFRLLMYFADKADADGRIDPAPNQTTLAEKFACSERTIRNWLDQLENLIYVGRPGRFRYTNQDHSLEMGIIASRMILEGRRYDTGEVAGLIEANLAYAMKDPVLAERLRAFMRTLV